MDTFEPAPAWQVSQWFNCQQAIDLDQLKGKVVLLHTFQLLCLSRSKKKGEVIKSQ